jgi:hypothetical protein
MRTFGIVLSCYLLATYSIGFLMMNSSFMKRFDSGDEYIDSASRVYLWLRSPAFIPSILFRMVRGFFLGIKDVIKEKK